MAQGSCIDLDTLVQIFHQRAKETPNERMDERLIWKKVGQYAQSWEDCDSRMILSFDEVYTNFIEPNENRTYEAIYRTMCALERMVSKAFELSQ